MDWRWNTSISNSQSERQGRCHRKSLSHRSVRTRHFGTRPRTTEARDLGPSRIATCYLGLEAPSGVIGLKPANRGRNTWLNSRLMFALQQIDPAAGEDTAAIGEPPTRLGVPPLGLWLWASFIAELVILRFRINAVAAG